MGKWDSLFEKGYYIGDLSELEIDMEEFDRITSDAINLSKNKAKHFSVQSVSSDPRLPHRISIEEEIERISFAKDEGIDVICYNYLLDPNDENEFCFEYLNSLIRGIVPRIFTGFNKDDIKISPGVLLYENGHYQDPHSDGHVGECVIIIYFSDPSTYNGSGKLNILKPFPEVGIIESMDPIKGKYIILEQMNHDVRHEVEMVTGDFKRFGFLAQVKKE